MLGCPKVMDSMTRQGTLAYHEGPQSDHWALYVDLDVLHLLDHHAHDNSIQPPQARVLKTGNPKAVAAYLTAMKEYYSKHNRVKRITQLHRKHGSIPDEQLRTLLEKWDLDQGRAMQHAESVTGSIKLKKHYWSPTLRNAGLLCPYWNLRKKSLMENCDMSNTIDRLQQMVHQHDPHFFFPSQHEAFTVHEIENHWKEAKNNLKRLQKDARELRYRSYEDMLATYEHDIYNPESVHQAKIIKSTIQNREMSRTVQANPNICPTSDRANQRHYKYLNLTGQRHIRRT
jgi:hypothetical protein